MNKNAYLERIGINDFDGGPTLDNLRRLQNSHLLNVAFENLDIHWGNEIVLDTSLFYKKVVERKRGGFCYELNGLFNTLLKEIGFKTRIVSARVCKPDGTITDEYAHLALLVETSNDEFLVDVGFGDFTAGPISIHNRGIQVDGNGEFRVAENDEYYLEVYKKSGEEWIAKYIMKSVERDLMEFSEMCVFQQTSPKSNFTKAKLCSLMLENGRKTLTDTEFIITADGTKQQHEVASQGEFDTLLKKEFGIVKQS